LLDDGLEGFLAQYKDTNVPPSLLEVIYKALTSTLTSRDEVEKQLASEDLLCPSLIEFQAAIRKSPSSKTGGPTGCTYDMIKLWPQEMITAVHAHIKSIWTTGRVPSFWNDKLLKPIPKATGVFSLGNLRPIMLLETTRKLWTGIIIRKIKNTWENTKILRPQQYGFRPHRSCFSALSQMIAVVEEAYESSAPLFMTSWDAVKAFDNVERPIACLALRRLGVPKQLATLLAYIDESDSIRVLTPFGISHPHSSRTFSSRKGNGQGDIMSPDKWTAVSDIGLTALSLLGGDFYTRGQDGILSLARDTAYADDEESYSSSITLMQQKADIKSATSIVLRLPLAISKFRFSVLQDSTWELPTGTPTLTLHGQGWTPIPITPSAVNQIKYLGAIQEVHTTSKGGLPEVLQEINTEIQRLNLRAGSPEAINLVIRAALGASVEYKVSCSCWPLSTYRTLDGDIRKSMKARLHLPSSFPTTLLYAHRQCGGLKTHSIALNAQINKLRLLRTSLASDPSTRAAISSLLGRAVRDTSGEWMGGVSSLSKLPFQRDCWARSLAEFLLEQDVTLHFTSDLAGNSLDTPIAELITNWSEVRPEMEQLGLSVIGDIVQHDRGNIPQLIISSRLAVLQLLAWRTPPFLPSETHILRPGQLWKADGKQLIDEILGWDSTLQQFCVRQWQMTNKGGRITLGQRVELTSTSRGAGSDTWYPMAHCMRYSTRLLLSADLFHNGSVSRKILFFCSAQVLPRHKKQFAISSYKDTSEIICTDGSWREVYNTYPPTSIGGCGIVIIPAESRSISWQAGFQTTSLPVPERAFVMELTAALTGYLIGLQRRTKFMIWTDCKAAISSLTPPFEQPAHHLKVFQRIAEGLRERFQGPHLHSLLRWVRSHGDKEAPSPQWAPETYGNIMADKMASRQEGEIQSVEEALKTLGDYTQWELWTVGANPQLVIEDIAVKGMKLAVQHYLQGRDHNKGNVQFHELTWLSKCYSDQTLLQWGSALKLLLRRFDRDMPHAEIPQCPCTQGPSSLNHALSSDCLLSHHTKIKDQARTDISLMLRNSPEILRLILSAMTNNSDIWRGQLTSTFWGSSCIISHLTEDPRGTIKTLKQVTRILVESSLSIYHQITNNLFKKNPHPEIPISARRKRSQQFPHKQNTPTLQKIRASTMSKKITDFFKRK
jgi:hypothetical protein